jgi:hypothetical protein
VEPQAAQEVHGQRLVRRELAQRDRVAVARGLRVEVAVGQADRGQHVLSRAAGAARQDDAPAVALCHAEARVGVVVRRTAHLPAVTGPRHALQQEQHAVDRRRIVTRAGIVVLRARSTHRIRRRGLSHPGGFLSLLVEQITQGGRPPSPPGRLPCGQVVGGAPHAATPARARRVFAEASPSCRKCSRRSSSLRKRLRNARRAGPVVTRGSCLRRVTSPPMRPRRAISRRSSVTVTVTRSDGNKKAHLSCRPPAAYYELPRGSWQETRAVRSPSLAVTSDDTPGATALQPEAVPRRSRPRIGRRGCEPAGTGTVP